MDVEKIKKALEHTAECKIIVFGDYALDKYLYIDPKRDEVSVETNLTAYQIDNIKSFPGVGGTIAANLRALNCEVTSIGITGEDGEGYELIQRLEEIGVSTKYMISDAGRNTCTYMKPMRLQPDGSYIEMSRLDIRNYDEPSIDKQVLLIDKLKEAICVSDAVIITDQYTQRGSGALTDYIRTKLCEMASDPIYKDKIFYVDSRAFADEYNHMIIKCNNYEFMSMGGGSTMDPDNPDDIITRFKQMQKKGSRYIVTRGSKGMMVFGDGEIAKVDAYQVDGTIDIVGAGDASNAGLVLGLCLDLNFEQAAILACVISSITIQQIGRTGTADIQSVLERLDRYKEIHGTRQ